MCSEQSSCGIVWRNSLQANLVPSLHRSSLTTPGIWLAFSKFHDIHDLYVVCVHRAHTRRFEVYPRSIRQALPCIRIPLAGNDPDVGLSIRAALEQAFDAGSYEQRIDYSKPCQPPLSADVEI